MTIGIRIKATREARGMSASAFAKLVGVSSTAVSNWENNSMEPRPASLTNIARALGVSTEYLQTGIDNGEPVLEDPMSILERAKKELSDALRTAPENIKLVFSVSV